MLYMYLVLPQTYVTLLALFLLGRRDRQGNYLKYAVDLILS